MQALGRRDEGFTLIELLVVILIIAILAAIAIPVFLQQREKGYASQVQSALKNAATALTAYSVGGNGTFLGANGALSDPVNAAYTTVLVANGYRKSPEVIIYVATAASDTEYCITAVHTRLQPSVDWQKAVYNSTEGTPETVDDDACPGNPPI